MEKPTTRKSPTPPPHGSRSAAARHYASRAAARRTARRSARAGRIERGAGSRSESHPAPGLRDERTAPFGPGGFGCAEGMIWMASDFDETIEDFDLGS